MSQVSNLSELCRMMAPIYEAMGYAAPTAADVLDLVVAEEQEKAARLNRVLSATENGRHERKFLRDERGQAFGHVAAEIPQDLYVHLLKDKRFGRAALESREGIEEIKKCFPSVRTKQAESDRRFIGTGTNFKRKRMAVRFMPGTLHLAA